MDVFGGGNNNKFTKEITKSEYAQKRASKLYRNSTLLAHIPKSGNIHRFSFFQGMWPSNLTKSNTTTTTKKKVKVMTIILLLYIYT